MLIKIISFLFFPLYAFSEHTILFVGDSITSTRPIECTPEYPKLVEKALKALDYDVQIINCAKAGKPSQYSREIVEEKLQEIKPDIIVIACGLVDTIINFSPITLKSNLERIIELSLNSQVKVILGKIDVSCWEHPPKSKPNVYLHAMNAVYSAIALRYPVATFNFVDSLILSSPKYNIGDFIHPSPAGDYRISCFLLPTLMRALDELNANSNFEVVSVNHLGMGAL